MSAVSSTSCLGLEARLLTSDPEYLGMPHASQGGGGLADLPRSEERPQEAPLAVATLYQRRHDRSLEHGHVQDLQRPLRVVSTSTQHHEKGQGRAG